MLALRFLRRLAPSGAFSRAMSTRRPFVGGNFKCNGTQTSVEVRRLAYKDPAKLTPQRSI